MGVLVFELFGKISLDDSEYSKKLSDAEGKTSKFSEALKKGVGGATKAVTAAFTTAVAGIAALTKSAVASYADYEQLVGGVDTLFKNASEKVQEYAQNAYKTAGMSANTYMETVTSFSASLLQSLDGNTNKAAEKANLAITDMSDNANKMGTAMDSIMNAYQGFSKQNYTMLDNLKLGYGGTKEEMNRLLKDANELNKKQGIYTNYQIDSYADIVDAIHVVQENMGITGTTALEAGTTIQGAMSSAKAAWANLTTALVAGDVSLDEKISEFVTTIVGDGTDKNLGVVGTVLPAVESAISGIGESVAKLSPVISEKLPALIDTLLPEFITAAGSLLTGLADAIPPILGTAIENLPDLVEAALKIIESLGNGIIEVLPELLNASLEIIIALANGIIEALPELLPAVGQVIAAFYLFLTEPDTLTTLIQAALDLIIALSDGLTGASTELLKATPKIIMNLVEGLLKGTVQLIAAAGELIASIVGGLGERAAALVTAGIELVGEIENGIGEKWESIKEWGKDLIDNFIAGIKERWENLKAAVSDTAQIVKDFLGFSEPEKGPLSDFHTYAPDMMDLYAEGIEKNSDKVLEKVEKLAGKIKDKLGEVESYFTTVSNISELEYELWENTEGLGASEAEKAAKKVELLNTQLATQKEVVDSTVIAYREMIRLYGENSTQALQYKQSLLEEQVEYSKIQNELKETTKDYQNLSQSQANWATVAIKAAKSVAEAVTDATKTATVTVQSQQESSNNIITDGINELVGLFKSGKAKTSVSNSRDFRSVSYG